MKKKILLVEDEPGLAAGVKNRLEFENFEVAAESTGDAGYTRARGETFDLILLDVGLPAMDGFDVCRKLRRLGIKTPIILLTARAAVADRVRGLKLGADDYLTKPFEAVELLSRIEALLRRAELNKTPAFSALEKFRFGEFTVDFRATELRRGAVRLEITAQELRLLRYLVEHRGETLSRHELLESVWGYETGVATRTVDVHIAGLRQKIETDPRRPRFILTLPKLGYKFTG
jgi:two-component system alkaline phosphatase synthesis response regulator PhoP